MDYLIVTLVFLVSIVANLYLAGFFYLQGFIHGAKQDISVLNKMPKFVKRIYGITIKD
jgi:hypothetical protein